jgi:hypothetical protein
MGETELSAILARLERAVGALEDDARSLADRLATIQSRSGDHRLRSEVAAAIDELNAMIGDKRG